ncbi:MAG: type II secretion system minor pseudopilin GspH [Gammaproteobacteria bacterium]
MKDLTPTSATGPCNSTQGRRSSSQRCSAAIRRPQSRPAPGGFSLLEVLVVVFIVGVLATMFTLSVGVTGGDRQLDVEVDRLRAVVKLAREEAVVQGREIGLRFYAGGYEFAAFYEDFVEYHDEDNPDQSEWALLDKETLLGPRELPDGLVFELTIDGREVVLKSADEVAAVSSQDAQDAEERSEAEEEAAERYQPQIMIYSSGDMSPFSVQVRRQYSNSGTTIEFEIDGETEVLEEAS